MLSKNSNMKARAKSLDGFYDRELAHMLTLRKKHADLLAKSRVAEQAMRPQSAHALKAEARRVRRQVHDKIVALRSVKNLADRYRNGSPLQAPSKRLQEAAE